MDAVRTLSLALLAAGLVALGAACGGGSDAPKLKIEQYVGKICAAARTYGETADKASSQYADVDPDKDPAAAKKAAVSLLGKDIKKAYEKSLADVTAAGQPDIKAGAQVQATIESSIRARQAELAAALKKANALDLKSASFGFDFLAVFDFKPSTLRAELEKLVSTDAAVQDVIDTIDEDRECTAVIFQDEPSTATRPGAGLSATTRSLPPPAPKLTRRCQSPGAGAGPTA